MKIRKNIRNNFGTIWSARTTNFTIALELQRSHEKYDGDDDDGSIQAELDSGELVMFDSRVVVYLNNDDDTEIGRDYLGSSVYKDGETHQFIKDGYFRDMLKTACNEARETIKEMRANLPTLREA